MSVRSNRWRRSVLLAGILITALGMIGFGGVAVAQDQPADEQQPQPTFKEEVEVTGTLIPRPTLEALAPVSTLEPEQIQSSGRIRLEDLLTSLPQVFASQNSTIANGASGTATVDLRNMGAVRTLVLIDGKRMAPGDPYSVSGDINFIPAFLVKRVDILSGGASSVYGADAVSGVVNFVMDRDFEGMRAGVQYNIFQHDNRNSTAQRIQEEAGFPYPSGSVWDGGAVDAYAAYGGKFADGKGHATAYVDYRKTSALRKDRRDLYNCAVSRFGSSGPSCGGSYTAPTGDFYDPTNGIDWTLDTSGAGNTFRLFQLPNDLFNYAGYNFMQRPDVRWTAGGYLNYKWNEHFEGYLDVMLMDDVTDAQIAPSGNFFVANYVNCNNPLLSQDEFDKICTAQGYGPDDDAYIEMGRRNVEGGGRNDHLEHTAYRLVGGLKGDINDNWSYDFYGLYGQTRYADEYQNDFNSLNIQNALFVITDPDTGQPVCRDETARENGCVPWNIFQAGGVTQAAIDYLQLPLLAIGGVKTQVISAKVNGDLESYGWKLPSASEGIKVAIGAEYRKEYLFVHPDYAYQQGWGAGQGGKTLPTEGGYNVKEGFAELLLPLIQDVPGAQDLTLELGYRYSDYSTTGGASTYKAQASYAPIPGLKFRLGHSRATRSPNVRELFRPQTVLLDGTTDPCAGDTPAYSQAQCALTGVTAAQYGHLRGNAAGQYNSLLGGNPNLDQEVSDTNYAGVVITPPGLAGFTATIDYFDIKIDKTIGYYYFDDILNTCATTGDLCDLIHRDPNGSLWVTPEGYTISTDANVGKMEGEGVDVTGSYLMPLGNSFLNFNMMGTYLIKQYINTGLFEYDCSGLFGNTCGIPMPEWRHRFQASWETGNLVLTLGWRFQGSVKADAVDPKNEYLYNPNVVDLYKINGSYENAAYNYFDLTATYNITKNVQFTLGCDNIMDKEAPLAVGFQDNDYGPGFYGFYDPYGRFIHSSLVFTF